MPELKGGNGKCCLCGHEGNKLPDHLTLTEIKIIMKRLDLRQKDLVNEFGVVSSTVVRALNGSTSSVKMRARIEEYLRGLIEA
jgi:hypothetical protein